MTAESADGTDGRYAGHSWMAVTSTAMTRVNIGLAYAHGIWSKNIMQIRIIDKGAGALAEALAQAPISLALKGAILGQLLDQRLLDSGGDGLFQAQVPAASGAGEHVVELRLGRTGEVFVTALRAFGPDVI